MTDRTSGMAPDPSDRIEVSAAEEDWTLNTEFDWNGHHHRAHIYPAEEGAWFIQIEDLDAYEVAVATSVRFRMPEPMLQSVTVDAHDPAKLIAIVVNQKKDRLIVKELLTLERNHFPTPPVEEQPVGESD